MDQSHQPTPLSELLTYFSSDKNTEHSYGPFYDQLCAELDSLDRSLRIMEIGVQHGGSIRALAGYFGKRATIYAVDQVASYVENLGPSVVGLVADQSDSKSLQGLLTTLQSKKVVFDLIIDDASHAIADQLSTVEMLFPLLAPGGYYVIEDLQHPQNAALFARWPGFTWVDLREVKGRCDDMLVVLRKPQLN